MSYEAYKQVVDILKQRCKLAFPVSIRRTSLKNLDGDCCLKDKKFYIRIDSNLSEASAIDTILHEFAHARAWNHLHDSLNPHEFQDQVHDASWGVAYSEVYQIYEKNFLKN